MHLHATPTERAPRPTMPMPAVDAAIAAAPVTAAAPLFDLGGAERRMHARAYGQWVALLHGRALPSIGEIDPATIAGFATHGVLLDFTQDAADPGIVHIGSTLRDECGVDGAIVQVAQVPPRSLLARLTDHHRRIAIDRAPVGFEAEFVGARGRTTLYRGILMPLSAPGGDGVDFVYGVINWKEVADPAVQARLDAELGAAMLAGLHGPHEAPVWADGPHAGDLAPPVDVDVQAPDLPTPGMLALGTLAPGTLAPGTLAPGTLADALELARDAAAALHTADLRRRAVLHRALGHAYDLMLAAAHDPVGYARLVGDPGATVADLVFGQDHDPAQRAGWAAVLDHARRHAVAAGRLPGFIEGAGGIDAIIAAERREKRRG